MKYHGANLPDGFVIENLQIVSNSDGSITIKDGINFKISLENQPSANFLLMLYHMYREII